MIRVFGCLVLLGLLAQTASASTVLKFGTDELTKRADVIVHGKVVKKESRKVEHGVVVTDYQIVVYEALKGAKGRMFKFTAYGGVVADRGSAISGSAKYHQNEEVLVFLSKTNKYGWRTAIGLAQGKYSIRKVEGKKLAFRDLEGLRLMDRKTGVVRKAKPEQGLLFSKLLAEVKQQLRKQKQKTGR